MSLVELHPEELLDREACGTLTPPEQDFLEAHVARCAACRIQRLARDDFASELAADDGHLDVALLVSHALRAANPVEPPVEAPIVVAPPVRRTRRPGRAAVVLLFAAAATLCAGVAAAAWSGLVPPLSRLAAPSVTSLPVTPAAPRAAAPRKTAPRPALVVDEPAAEPVASVAALEAPPARAPAETTEAHAAAEHPTPAPLAAAPLVAPSEAHHAAEPHARTSSESPTTHREEVVSRPTRAEPATPPEPRSAADLFSEANEALRAGDKGTAQGRYRELLRLYPTSPEARVSRATLGRLLLEQGEGAAALRTFDESLSSGAGAMAEEVMVGRALSFQRLGDTRGEASAWLALLSTHPGSIHAERARARLAALSPR
jgi:TolA-binding protein